MHSVGDLVMCFSDINGHVGRHIDEFYGVHEGYRIDENKLEGGMLLEICLKKELWV